MSLPNQEVEVNPDDLSAVQKLVSFLIPESVKQLAGMLADTVKGWRARNMVNVILKTKDHIEASGLTQTELSGKFIVKAIEAASDEDNDSLQNRWALLLSNAATGKITQDIKFITILSELNDLEVRFLDSIYSELLNFSGLDECIFSTEKASQNFNIKLEDAKIMVDNFYRLNICRPPSTSGMKVSGFNTGLQTNLAFCFTDLGISFLKAVR
jgi:hypothetical protein